jgi:hypothetical protein
MKVVLFDLGKTLEDQDVLLPGARETLQTIQAMRDPSGETVALALVSDFDMPDDPSRYPLSGSGITTSSTGLASVRFSNL